MGEEGEWALGGFREGWEGWSRDPVGWEGGGVVVRVRGDTEPVESGEELWL